VKYFIDTEFIEDGKTIDLISIGIVREDGRTLYLESSEVDWSKASQWVLDNVKPHLTGEHPLTRGEIANEVNHFLRSHDDGSKPEIWGYYADYDWVVVCQLWGTMMDLPKGLPMFCMDIKQEAMRLGNPKLPEQDSTEHHALADAKWNKLAWEFLAATPNNNALGGGM